MADYDSKPSAGPVRHYTDLEVWRLGMEVADAVYEASDAFPKDEVFGLASQVRRATVSIPTNIAEGWRRGRTKEYVQFLGTLADHSTRSRRNSESLRAEGISRRNGSTRS